MDAPPAIAITPMPVARCKTPAGPMSIKQVADRLNVSHWSVRRWIRTHRLKALRCSSRCFRIREVDLADFIQRNTR